MDPIEDTNRVELVKIAQRYTFPKFVKQADIDTTMSPDQIAVTSYADPVRKRYPCQNAAATWMSAAYFHEKSAEYHLKDRERICERLEKFADWFGIRPEYDALVKRAEQLRADDQLPDSSYAFVWQAQDGTKERHYPLDTPANIKIAAEWLYKERDAIPFHERNVIANKILEKAAAKGAGLGEMATDFIEKQAGRGIPDPPELYQMLEFRAGLAKQADHKAMIHKLAETIKQTPRVAMQPNELVKLAVAVDMVDHALNLKGRYTDMIKRPEDVIFKITYTKAASDHAQICTLQTGSFYDKSQLAKLAREDVESLFGTEFANEVCTGLEIDPEKMAAVAHTLPRPDAELLEAVLSEAGQQPQMRKAAEFEPIDDETLKALAAAYQ